MDNVAEESVADIAIVIPLVTSIMMDGTAMRRMCPLAMDAFGRIETDHQVAMR